MHGEQFSQQDIKEEARWECNKRLEKKYVQKLLCSTNKKKINDMKGRTDTLKADQGAIVLQLQRSTKVNMKRGNGKANGKQETVGTRAVMSGGLWKRAGECVALFNDGAAF